MTDPKPTPSAAEIAASKLPTRRPGALAAPHLHRPDVHPLAGIVETLVQEGFQSSAAENIADQLERWLHDATADTSAYAPRNVAAIAVAQVAPPRPQLQVVPGPTSAQVQAQIDAGVAAATAQLNAKVDELLRLVTPAAPMGPPFSYGGASSRSSATPLVIDPKGFLGERPAPSPTDVATPPDAQDDPRKAR